MCLFEIKANCHHSKCKLDVIVVAYSLILLVLKLFRTVTIFILHRVNINQFLIDIKNYIEILLKGYLLKK